GLIARVEVRQRFRNPGSRWQEGIYVFPLPENAAVDGMALKAGGRVIEGRIAEREEAKRSYQRARDQGKRSSLVEQERPNVFTTSIANIAPGEEVTVEIAYQQTLRFDSGEYRLRFPMVVGPRYIPDTERVAGLAGSGWGRNTSAVPDAARITPPVRHPLEGLGNLVSFHIALDAGVPLARVRSAFLDFDHAPAPGGRGRVRIDVEGDALPADRDFELVWTPAPGPAPGAALFAEILGDEAYVRAMVVPRGARRGDDDAPATPPREAIFVIDTSGSMAGASLPQARAALRLALDELGPRDRFNVIQFNSRTSRLFSFPPVWACRGAGGGLERLLPVDSAGARGVRSPVGFPI
ncbi:MAG: VIT domain-containing protein, partial [Nitrospinota bacterium]